MRVVACYWLRIDHLQVIRDYGSRIYRVHAKDTEIPTVNDLGPKATEGEAVFPLGVLYLHFSARGYSTYFARKR